MFISAAITCSSLIAPTNGVITYNTDATAPHDFGTLATYQCNPGYGLTAYSLSVTTNPRTCSGNSLSIVGNWNGPNLGCERKK